MDFDDFFCVIWKMVLAYNDEVLARWLFIVPVENHVFLLISGENRIARRYNFDHAYKLLLEHLLRSWNTPSSIMYVQYHACWLTQVGGRPVTLSPSECKWRPDKYRDLHWKWRIPGVIGHKYNHQTFVSKHTQHRKPPVIAKDTAWCSEGAKVVRSNQTD